MHAQLTVERLRDLAEHGEIDTVVVAFTDVQGRLQGKRLHVGHFLDVVADRGAEACAYLLATDVDMRPVDGYAMNSWATGFGDFVLRPDPVTLRFVPWQRATALVLCDVEWPDGRPVVASPRQILRRQVDRLAERGLVPYAATELEFVAFDETYEEARRRRYQGLSATSDYSTDYSLLGTARVEPYLRRLRNEMAGAGLVVESAKGECNLGQHEVVFRYDEALTTADQHAIYKTGAKEIAVQEGLSVTFMAKVNEREGNSCHVHLSLRSPDGTAVMADSGGEGTGLSPLMEHFLAGQLACASELTLLYAPNVNSYKRFVDGSFAPTRLAWGRDNRTCAMRVVGHGTSLRVENRLPGADVNPYLAIAAMIAAGLHGIERELPLEPQVSGDAYGSNRPRVPSTLRAAAELFDRSALARDAFGDDVVEHYLNAARIELDGFDAAVTDWELIRGFERL
ncbi:MULTISPECIES: glutamine synthetase family protein [Nocardioides]|uniref:Glutamine synthetase family protein n=1 Tax=Nocardioides vastitatis TaxID=2568655 RepID=A0ABW0ZL58_9ACTN|nr:glutamine synthetase family protein [Nocardioides sp.]